MENTLLIGDHVLVNRFQLRRNFMARTAASLSRGETRRRLWCFCIRMRSIRNVCGEADHGSNRAIAFTCAMEWFNRNGEA